MRLKSIVCSALIAGGMAAAQAQSGLAVKRIAEPKAKFSTAVWAGDTLYVAGQMASPVTPADAAKGTPASYGDTKAQTMSVLTKIQSILKDQGLTMGDVVQMTVFLAGDPASGGKMDFAGMNDTYSKFFGTAEQPNRPTRAAVQVAGLAASWGLVEIVVVAARSK